MYTCAVRPEIASLSAYVPGMSIAEVQGALRAFPCHQDGQQRKPAGGIAAGTKGAAPPVWKRPSAIRRAAIPRLRGSPGPCAPCLPRSSIVVGNGSDEIIDMLIRMLAWCRADIPWSASSPASASIPSRRRICGVEVRRRPLSPDFSFDLDALLRPGGRRHPSGLRDDAGQSLRLLPAPGGHAPSGSNSLGKTFSPLPAGGGRGLHGLCGRFLRG